MVKPRTFENVDDVKAKEFKPLINTPKNVEIAGENDFSSNALNEIIPTKESTSSKKIQSSEIVPTTKSNRVGRPVTIKDQRYKVSRPKMISPALESKLATLEDYIEEFQDITGRITFERYVDTLVESYIKTKLGVSKEEHLRTEIDEAFEKIKLK